MLAGLLAACVSGPGTARADQIISVGNGDAAGLAAALQQANQTVGVTTVLLAQRGTYAISGNLPTIGGNIVLEGRGATLRPANGAEDSAGRIVVNPQGSVWVREVTFRGYVSAPLETFGRLTLEAVSLIGNVPLGVGVSGSALIATRPGGQLAATNVTVADNVTSGNQQFIGLVYNQGTTELRNVTIARNVRGSGATGPVGPFAVFNEAQASTVNIANSLLVNVGINQCAGPVTLMGGNVLGDSSCGATATDIAPSNVVGSLDSTGMVPVLPLLAGSVAVDRGVASLCVARDALGTMRTGAGAAAGCDSGAYEVRAQAPLVDDGLNGVYHGSNSDGQYVSIQRLGAATALVVWYGFDGAGRNTWVFGVGNVVGKRIDVDAFQQTGGTLGSDGVVRGSQVVSFGTLVVNLESCDAATLDYASMLSAFGSGRVPLRRLTVTHNLGCAG